MRRLLLFCSLLILIVSKGHAQSRIIKGVVIDNAAKPVTGATVAIVETQKATTTDINGNFQIQAENGQTLRVSYVGTAPVSVTIRPDSKDLQIQINATTSNLNELVVTGYTTERKKDLTGSV